MVEFKILVFFESLHENHRKGVSLKVGNNFHQEYFLQHFEVWSRGSNFDALSTTANRI